MLNVQRSTFRLVQTFKPSSFGLREVEHGECRLGDRLVALVFIHSLTTILACRLPSPLHPPLSSSFVSSPSPSISPSFSGFVTVDLVLSRLPQSPRLLSLCRCCCRYGVTVVVAVSYSHSLSLSLLPPSPPPCRRTPLSTFLPLSSPSLFSSSSSPSSP
jgi:hypothetical protein